MLEDPASDQENFDGAVNAIKKFIRGETRIGNCPELTSESYRLAAAHAFTDSPSSALQEVVRCLIEAVRDYIIETRGEYLEGGRLWKLSKSAREEDQAIGMATHGDNRVAESVFAVFKLVLTRLGSISAINAEGVTMAKFGGLAADLRVMLVNNEVERMRVLLKIVDRHASTQRMEMRERDQKVRDQVRVFYSHILVFTGKRRLNPCLPSSLSPHRSLPAPARPLKPLRRRNRQSSGDLRTWRRRRCGIRRKFLIRSSSRRTAGKRQLWKPCAIRFACS